MFSNAATHIELQKYQSLLEHNPAGIWIFDMQGTIQHMNPAAEKMTGYSLNELQNQSFDRLLNASERERVVLIFLQRASEPFQYETQLLHKQGHLIDVGVKSIPIFVEEKLIGFHTIARDISDFRRAKEELRATQELLESLFQNIGEGIHITDTDGHVIRVNHAFESMYGWTEEEIRGMPLPQIPDHLKGEMAELLHRLSEGETIGGMETVRKKKDGSLMNVRLTISPLKDSDGGVIAYSGINKDISEQKKMDDFIKISDKLHVVGKLAAGMAHEIRNPLTALRGFLQLFQSNHPVKQEHINIMLSEIDRINSIISEFLLIAKPESAAFSEHPIDRILTDVLSLLESHALMSNVQLRLEIDQDLSLIRCSEAQIKQLLINIFKNAIEAMPDGGVVEVKAKTKDVRMISIQVIDHGVGIPEELLPRIGEPFFTTKENGTGLGAMICYKIVEAHGGVITFSSQPMHGTMVEVTLPTLS